MKDSVIRIFNLIKNGELKFVINGVSKRIFSKTEAFGLKRDLTIDFKTPKAQIDLLIRPFQPKDKAYFKADLQNGGLVEKNIPICYVATTSEDIPCHRHWLMDYKQNENIKAFWGESFPVLNADEALIESIFTIPKYRSKGIMPAVLDKMAKKSKNLGLRYLILFVEIDNIPSLKGSHRSGFEPYVLRTEKWFLFKREISFKDLSSEVLDSYLKNVARNNFNC